MPRRIACLAVLALALAVAPVRADPSTGAFDLFRTDLAARVAALSGDLPPAQQQEKVLLEKIAAALAAPSSGFAGDVRMAFRIAKLVKKKALHDSPLLFKFLESTYFLSADLSVLLNELRTRVQTIPDSALRDKADAALDKLAQRLDAAASQSDPVRRVHALLGATKGSGKAQAKVEKAEAAADGGSTCVETGSMTAQIDGVPLPLHHVTGQLTVLTNGSVNVVVRGHDGPGDTGNHLNLGIVSVFTGPRTYVTNNSTVSGRRVGPEGTLDDVSGGTITIEQADPASGRIKGSFDLTARSLSPQASHRYSGSFEVTCANVVRL